MGYTERQQQFSLCSRDVSSRVTNDVTPLYLLHQYAQKRREVNLKHDLIKHLFGDQECTDFARAHCDVSSFFAFPARELHWYLPWLHKSSSKEKAFLGCSFKGSDCPLWNDLSLPLKKIKINVSAFSWCMLLRQTQQQIQKGTLKSKSSYILITVYTKWKAG